MKSTELYGKICNENSEVLAYAYERWQDEKEYEDINDYLEYIKQYIPEAYKIQAFNSFLGLMCHCDEGTLKIMIYETNGNIALHASLA